MANEVLGLEVAVELGEARKAFESLPKTIDKDLKLAVSAYNKSLKSIEAKQKKLLGDKDKADREAAALKREQEKAAKALEDTFKGILEIGGVETDSFDDYKDALTGLLTPAGAATVAIIGTTLAVAGLATGFVALIGNAREMDDSLDGLEKISGFEGLSPAALSSVDDATASYDALKSIATEGALVLAEELAPAAAQLGQVTVQLGLAALDAWKELGKGRGLAKELAEVFGVKLVQALTFPIDGLFDIVEGVGYLLKLIPGMEKFGGSIESFADGWDDMVRTSAKFGVDALFAGTSWAVDELNDSFDEHADKATDLIGTQKKLAATERDAAAAAKAEAAATKAQAEAAKALAEETQALNAAEAERVTAAKASRDAYDGAIASLNDAEAASKRAVATREEQAVLDHEAALQFLEDERDKALAIADAAESASARETVEAEFRAAKTAEEARSAKEIKEIRQDLADAAKAADDKIAADAQALAEKTRDTYLGIASQIGSVAGQIGSMFEDALSETRSQIEALDGQIEGLGLHTVEAAGLSGDALVDAYVNGQVAAEDLSEAQKQFLEESLLNQREVLEAQAKSQRDSALIQFAVTKAASISEAAVNTAVAATAALKLGPIAGPIAAGAITALGATQIGLIAAEQPKFHAGGLAPDELPATLRAGEGVLSGQGVRAAGGGEGVRALNRGEAGGSMQPIYVEMRYGHKVYDRMAIDNLRSGGTLSKLSSRSWHAQR